MYLVSITFSWLNIHSSTAHLVLRLLGLVRGQKVSGVRSF